VLPSLLLLFMVLVLLEVLLPRLRLVL